MIAAGTLIDNRYRVLAKIGSGGMADVYLAEDELLGRRVAVKVLQERFVGDAEFVERFRREASAAASLSHPNVVAIFDRGSWDGTYYIAMEYVAGRTLKELIREQGPLDPPRAIEIAIQVLRAAAYAHRHGVIHRDLKPHNIILGEEGRVAVTDFGIAHAGGGDITHTGSIMGTAQYLSPEQAQGTPVSEASDIYAVGILLYELLTGTVPFQGDSPVAVALQHLSTAPRPPSELNPAVDPQLDQVVLKALAKDPNDRYTTADRFIDALEAVRGRHNGAAGQQAGIDQMDTASFYPPAPLVVPPEPGASRRRWPWAVGALLVGGGIAAAVLLLVGAKGKVAVPSLVGQSQASAVQELRQLDLVGIAAPAPSAAPPGTVIAQRPRPGTLVDRGSDIYITVSTGAQTALIPKVAGLPERKAVALLQGAGFKPLVSMEASSQRPAGQVIATNPPEAVEAQRGTTVVLYVSSGPSSSTGAVKVPALVGLTETAALEALSAAGLAGTVGSHRESSLAQPGTVLAQTPTAGSELAKGGTVTLTVAAPLERATVPNVVGKSETTAAAELGAAGFKVATRSEPVSEREAVGLVVEQLPAAGRRAKPGSTVTIVVGVSQLKTTSTSTTPEGAPR